MKYELPRYSRITKRSALNIPDTEDYETEIDKLIEEQNEKLKIFGYEDTYESMHLIHFFNSPFFNEKTKEMTIDDAIQYLAIKDGYDLVSFENGNKGYVAYYNTYENGFEILV